MTPELLERLKQYKPDLLAAVHMLDDTAYRTPSQSLMSRRWWLAPDTIDRRLRQTLAATSDQDCVIRLWAALKHIEFRVMIAKRAGSAEKRQCLDAIRSGFELCREAVKRLSHDEPNDTWAEITAKAAAEKLHSERLMVMTRRRIRRRSKVNEQPTRRSEAA